MQVISVQHPISVMRLPSKPLSRLIFCQGFFPYSLKVHLLHKAVVLLVVHSGYFIFPVPTISGEPSPIHHLGRCWMGDQQLHMSAVQANVKIKYGNKIYMYSIKHDVSYTITGINGIRTEYIALEKLKVHVVYTSY